MTKQWQGGCLRIEIQEANGPHPLDDQYAHVYIYGQADGEEAGEVQAEGALGVQLAHLLHACVVLSNGEFEEWFVPSGSRPLHMRRLGRHIEIIRYPTPTAPATEWLQGERQYLVDFGVFLESLSSAVEWVLAELSGEFAQDDSVRVLLHQWERAWQRFSRLATFQCVTLQPAM